MLISLKLKKNAQNYALLSENSIFTLSFLKKIQLASR
jgi:hypothetical protein